MTDSERAAAGIGTLPENLHEAIEIMEGSELMAEALGEHVFEYFIKNKRAEWDAYKAEVTPLSSKGICRCCEPVLGATGSI